MPIKAPSDPMLQFFSGCAIMAWIEEPRRISKVASWERWGVHLCRISIAIVFIWIGWLKFIPYEADSIVPFVANSPFMSWLYNNPGNYLQYMNPEGSAE